jgi:hypothetical protein
VSLISDALKRVRQETARLDAEQKGVWLRRGPRQMSRRPGWQATLVVSAVALAASLAALFLVYRAAPSAPESPPVGEGGVVEVAPIGPSSGGSEAPRAASPQESADMESERKPVGEQAAAGRPAPALTPPGQSSSVAAPVPGEPAVLTAVQPAASAGEGAAEPRSYVRTIELPGGGSLELGGIAWSETSPVALLNGKAVGRGEVVEGCLVVEIEPAQIELRYDEQTIYLRLK